MDLNSATPAPIPETVQTRIDAIRQQIDGSTHPEALATFDNAIEALSKFVTYSGTVREKFRDNLPALFQNKARPIRLALEQAQVKRSKATSDKDTIADIFANMSGVQAATGLAAFQK